MSGGRWRVRLTAALALAMAAFVELPTSPAAAYDGYGAANYADYWWNRNNPNYKTINDDCTNFVSQALHDPSGGRYPYRFGPYANSDPSDDHNWWERYFGVGVFGYTNSFTFATHLHQFLIYDLPGGIPEGNTSRGDLSAQMARYTPDAMVTGDVLFYDFGNGDGIDHAAIQVGIDNGTWIATYANGARASGYHNVVDQHSNSRYHVHWSLIDTNTRWAYTAIYFMHIDIYN